MIGDRSPGWDKRCINAVAKRDYGGLEHMFAAHGWDKAGATFGQIAPTRVVQTYGSVEAFAETHPEHLPEPMEVIESGDVWLTSYYGYTPEHWGYLGWTLPGWRTSFLRRSRPGALVVIYGTGSASDPAERMQVLGVQQQSHIRGWKQDFISPDRWADEQTGPEREAAWRFGLRTKRAWKITSETRPYVQAFAAQTWTPGRATVIGAQGMKLTLEEARGLLGLDLFEVSVFGQVTVEALIAGAAESLLRPSQPGPVSQSPHIVREAEGPKHLYILELVGNADQFLDRPVGPRLIVKVGFSVSPVSRCLAHNRALPACAFSWRVLHSTFAEGRDPFPSSGNALAGEAAMKNILHKFGESLGGEFFLSGADDVHRAWREGIEAAWAWTR